MKLELTLKLNRPSDCIDLIPSYTSLITDLDFEEIEHFEKAFTSLIETEKMLIDNCLVTYADKEK